MRARAKVLWFLGSAFLFLAVAFVATSLWYLRSDGFQEYVRTLLVSKLAQSTGLSCKVERLQLNPFRGSFRITDLVLSSPTDAPSAANISIDEISGSFRMRSLLRVRFILDELNVVRPRIALTTGGGKFKWNPEEFLKACKTSLELEAGKAYLREGWLEINNRQIPFDISLSDLICEVHYAGELPSYKIHIAYQKGKFDWAERKLVYDLDVRAQVSLTGIDIDSIAISYGKSRLSGNGWMRDWESPVLLLHASGTVAGGDLAVFDRHLLDATGNINVSSNFRWDSAGFHSTARFSAAEGSYRKVRFSSLTGMMEIEKGVLTLRDVEGRIGEGLFQSQASFHLSTSDPKPHQFQTAVKALSLLDVAGILDIPGIAYENAVEGTVGLSWRHGSRDLELNCEILLHEPQSSARAGVMRTGLHGDITFGFSKGIWYLTTANLQSANSDLHAIGSDSSGFHLQLQTYRPAEILDILRNFSSSLRETLAKYPDLMDISGGYALTGDVIISPSSAVSCQGSLHLENPRWRSYALESLAARAFWNGNELDLQSLIVHKGKGTAEGSFNLVLPEEEEQSPHIAFKGNVRQVQLRSFREIGIDLGEDLDGELNGEGSISGREGSWQGEGHVSIDRGTYRGESFDNLRGQARLSDDVLHITDCRLTRGPAKLDIQGQVRLKERVTDLTVRLADFSLRSLPAAQENKVDVDGTVSASGHLQGAFDNLSLTGILDLGGLRYASWDLGRGKGTLEVKDKLLTVRASVRSDLGSFNLHAVISTDSGHPGKVDLELKDWNVRKLITTRMPPYLSDLSTALEGKVEITGSFDDPGLLSYRGEMDGARFKFHEYELSNSGKIRFTAAKGKLHVAEGDATIVGEGTRLSLRGDIPLAEDASLDLRLDGNLNLKMMDQVGKRVQVAGSADLSVRATGTPRNPQVIGRASLNGMRLDYADLPFRFAGVHGDVIFSRNLVRLENVQGTMASGTFLLSGAFEHQNAEMRGINLQISARKARFPYPKDFRSVVDADLTLRGSPDSQVLAGDVFVIRSEYLREFNLLEQLASRGATISGPLTSDPFLVGLRLNIGIRSDEGFFVDNELTKLRGSMRLTLRGTPAYPSLTGRIESAEGSIFFRGNRFDIVRASADFIDRNRINPLLDVRAESDVRSYRLLLDVNGDLDHLRFNVTSDPPLSTVDILTLLTTGKEREPGEINSRRQAEITGLSAASILSESLTGALGKRVQRLFGLQTFRVDPFLAGAENDPTARVTISERVSKDLNITFSRNLSTNEEQIVIVEYEVNKNLSIIGTRNENGEFGLDLRFRKRFR